ncbi:SDR family oxidoreductase [Marixanthomonas spongiae]|uniref:Short-chain dehydrogenase n=1 Tax=Marixanthomonas spongiae TaxID=2174845 RepID=A0A2U0I3C9_9FLAO|nr:SDR family oxidoreductase [Marixanthomonas spongiae]PVW15599.1 short-chain dehydrogenase [Marixanthomonas spongiae]
MAKEFSNQWALILGGSSGLGLASAHKLAEAGMNVCIVHRTRKSDMQALHEELKRMKDAGVEVMDFNKDALKETTIKAVLASIPKNSCKLLLHSIAKGSLKTMQAAQLNMLSMTDLDITLHGMATSWYEWTQALIAHETFTENARNIAFTSEGNAKVWPGYGAVSAAKATLEALMRQMAVELAPLNITTNCIQAGTTLTPSFKMIPGSETLTEQAKKRSPFNRLTTPEDVANSVYLLCKDEANWINGTILTVDGGESLQ